MEVNEQKPFPFYATCDWTDGDLRYALVREAIALLDAPSLLYQSENHGLEPQNGFDCSGFINYLFRAINYPLPPNLRHANQLFDALGVLTHLPRRGDLVFFSRNGQYPSHVGIMIDPWQFIHAPGKNYATVTLAPLEWSDIVPKPNVVPRRILYTHNPIGFKRPTFPRNSRWADLS